MQDVPVNLLSIMRDMSSIKLDQGCHINGRPKILCFESMDGKALSLAVEGVIFHNFSQKH